MRVIAFSCAHISRPETQMELYGRHLDYSAFERLRSLIHADPPDAVVSLGDLWEPMYDSWDVCSPWVDTLDFIKVRGNHDPGDGLSEMFIDGVMYEHGHLNHRTGKPLKQYPDVDSYNEAVRAMHEGRKLVHGHTHIPFHDPSEWPMDVGSITHSATYGEIIDGEPFLRAI